MSQLRILCVNVIVHWAKAMHVQLEYIINKTINLGTLKQVIRTQRTLWTCSIATMSIDKK